jgi:amidase
MTIKDALETAGVRTTGGHPPLKDHVPKSDAAAVAKLRAAGAILLGKTNVPPLSADYRADNPIFGRTNNPWDLERTPGGSSGGAAAAVAGGLAPLAHASDGGGSIRIPASACGLFGIKPSRGRVSTGPVQHDVTGLGTSGPLARTVADAATLLDVLAGAMPGSPYGAPSLPAGETFASYARRDPGRLRIAALPQPPIPGVELHPDCRAAHDAAAGLLRDLGHEVDELELPADETLRNVFEAVWSVLAAMRPVPPPGQELLMPLTRHLRAAGGKVGAVDFAGALYAFRALGQLIADALLSTYDVLLTPTLAQPPTPVGGLRDDDDPSAEFDAMGHFTPFTPLYNATGQPAVSLPLHWTADGLPIGVMLGGRYGEDATLVSLSAQLERARPWAARRPAVWTA